MTRQFFIAIAVPSPLQSPFQSVFGKSVVALAGLGAIAYTGTCLYLHFNQRQFLYNPRRELRQLPDSEQFGLPFEELEISVEDGVNLHSWWIPAPTAEAPYEILAGEPVNVLEKPKTLLYFYGRSGNKSSGTSLHRATAMRQLGFSILMTDYRGFGASEGEAPSEAQMYEDSEIAWRYLTETRGIYPSDIIIYGESMGGAVAINLASRHPEAQALIAQSTFTSMTAAVRQNPLFKLLPLEIILTDKFDSIAKVPQLQMPTLFIHGTDDVIVSSLMAEQLFAAAPEPKQLHLVAGAGHFGLYKPGKESYLRAIAQFLQTDVAAREISLAGARGEVLVRSR